VELANLPATSSTTSSQRPIMASNGSATPTMRWLSMEASNGTGCGVAHQRQPPTQWAIYPEITDPEYAASDHAAIFVDINI
jgi:hypothetical protein